MEKAYKSLKLVLLVLCFVAVLLGARVLYDRLGSSVETDALAQVPAETAVAEEEAQLAPDILVFDEQGGEHRLSDYQGKPVILNFWASWCGPCKSEMPAFQEKYQLYGDQIQFLMVNLTDGSRETVDTALAFVEGAGYTFPVFYDTEMDAALNYNVSGVPVTYFIDAQGALVAWQQGAMSADMLQRGIDMLLN